MASDDSEATALDPGRASEAARKDSARNAGTSRGVGESDVSIMGKRLEVVATEPAPEELGATAESVAGATG